MSQHWAGTRVFLATLAEDPPWMERRARWHLAGKTSASLLVGTDGCAMGLGPTQLGYERTLDGGWLALGDVAGIGPARSRDLVEGISEGRGETVAE